MRVIVLLAFCAAAVSAIPASSERIAGGALTTIEAYPTIVGLLYTANWFNYMQTCGGTILNNRSILTAARCPRNDPANRWRVRIGSSLANNGGEIITFERLIVHADFDLDSYINDIAILHTTRPIVYSNVAAPASIAGPNYVVADGEPLIAAGWGDTLWGTPSEQLRHVQILAVNQAICSSRYASRGITITNNMFCSGWLDMGGRDACRGDFGGPIYHSGTVVGIISFNNGCASPQFPSVNTRVSNYTSWIQANA